MIVGIGHRSRHGKDTVCNYLIEWVGDNRPRARVKKLSWAWKLKDVCYQLYGHLGLREPEFYETPEGQSLKDVKLPLIGKSPVEVWVDIGTPAVRERVWDQTWVAWVRAQQGDYDIIFCPDTRFPNEVAACDTLIKVVNPRVPDRAGKSVDDLLAGFDGWHHVVSNDADLAVLRDKAFELASYLFWEAIP